MKKIILKIMLGAIIVEALLVSLFILLGNFDTVSWRAMGSVAIIFAYSIPCLFYSKVYDHEQYKYIAFCGSGLACVSALLYILRIWEFISFDDFLMNFNGTLSSLIWMLAFICWFLSISSRNDTLNLFKKISITLTILLTSFSIISIWNNEFLKDMILRLYFVLIVLTVGSYICTYILSRIYSKNEVIETQPENVIPTNNVSVEVQNPVVNSMTDSNMNTNQPVNTVSNPSMGVVSNEMPVNSQSAESVSNVNNNIESL